MQENIIKNALCARSRSIDGRRRIPKGALVGLPYDLNRIIQTTRKKYGKCTKTQPASVCAYRCSIDACRCCTGMRRLAQSAYSCMVCDTASELHPRLMSVRNTFNRLRRRCASSFKAVAGSNAFACFRLHTTASLRLFRLIGEAYFRLIGEAYSYYATGSRICDTAQRQGALACTLKYETQA